MENRIDHLGFLCCGVWILAGSNKSKWRQRILIPKWTSQLSVFSQLVTSLAFIWEAAMQRGQELHWWLILFLTHWLQSPVGRYIKSPVWNTENETEHVHTDVCAHIHTQHIHTHRHRWTLKNCSWLFRLNLCHLEQTQQLTSGSSAPSFLFLMILKSVWSAIPVLMPEEWLRQIWILIGNICSLHFKFAGALKSSGFAEICG